MVYYLQNQSRTQSRFRNIIFIFKYILIGHFSSVCEIFGATRDIRMLVMRNTFTLFCTLEFGQCGDTNFLGLPLSLSNDKLFKNVALRISCHFQSESNLEQPLRDIIIINQHSIKFKFVIILLSQSDFKTIMRILVGINYC